MAMIISYSPGTFFYTYPAAGIHFAKIQKCHFVLLCFSHILYKMAFIVGEQEAARLNP